MDEQDARDTVAQSLAAWPASIPHRAMQLCEYTPHQSDHTATERDAQCKAADHWMTEACAEHNRNIDLSTGFDALAERVNALEADAERYRWLKPRLLGADFDWNEEGNCVLVFEMPNDATVSANCDETIDAAIKGATT